MILTQNLYSDISLTAFTTESLPLKTPEVLYKDQSYIKEGCPDETHLTIDLRKGVEATKSLQPS